MGKETYSWNKAKLEDSLDESGDYNGPGLNAPKYSPMRRKEKFRTKDFKTEKRHKDRKRNLRNKIKYAGTEIKIDNIRHVFMREDDILSILE